MAEIDLEIIRHSLQTAREHRFAEVEIELGDSQFSAHLEPTVAKKVSIGATATVEVSDTATVNAPLVGYFREATSPVGIGDKISKGQVVGVITALGILNEVESKVAGEVTEVLVQRDEPLQFGQAMFRVKL